MPSILNVSELNEGLCLQLSQRNGVKLTQLNLTLP